MPDKNEGLRKQWERSAKKFYVGRTIKDVFYMNDKTQEELGWDKGPAIFVLDNGTHFFASSDDEGNSAGSIFSSTGSGELPVI